MKIHMFLSVKQMRNYLKGEEAIGYSSECTQTTEFADDVNCNVLIEASPEDIVSVKKSNSTDRAVFTIKKPETNKN